MTDARTTNPQDACTPRCEELHRILNAYDPRLIDGPVDVDAIARWDAGAPVRELRAEEICDAGVAGRVALRGIRAAQCLLPQTMTVEHPLCDEAQAVVVALMDAYYAIERAMREQGLSVTL